MTLTAYQDEPKTLVVVHLRGALDYGTASALSTAIEPLWGSLAGGHPVLDLQPLTFATRSG